MRFMPSLRMRLIGLFVLLALTVAGVMIVAVERLGSDQIMKLAMQSGFSKAEARAMFDRSIGGVLLVAAALGVGLGGVAGWWLLRRVLRPLDRLAQATRAIAAGNLAVRVPPAPDPELQLLGESFNTMASSLERVEELRRRLVEDVAHELRTPLTSLQGYIEAMADGVVEATPEMLRTVHEEIVRVTRLVEDLDRLGRVESDGAREESKLINIETLVRRAATIQTPRLLARGMTLRLEIADALPLTRADPDAVLQVLTNLLENAVRYGDEGSEIVQKLRVDPADRIECSVENEGDTIPASELPLIWERLYRVDQSRSRARGGSGIGLAIVREIVESHGGSVGASSDDGRTRISFVLPSAVRG